MNAEIIAVGSELLTGQHLDTNSLFLTEQLNNLGVEVVTKCVVGDHCERLAASVRAALTRSQILILSGGLGPTEDDVTREAVGLALDRRLNYHPEIAEQLEQRFAQMKRRMAEVNRRQAFIVEGAEVLPNDRGTAPGQWIEERDQIVILLPGPPHELKAMFTRQCVPRLERRVPRAAICTLSMRVTGIPESDLDQLISPAYKKYDNPVTTILAGPGDIQIHLRARCQQESEALVLLAELGGQIQLLLGDRIYSHSGEPLEAVIGELLRKSSATLAVAESCTGGLLGERLTSVAGSSDYFLGGFICYSNRLKTELLGVSEQMLEEFGAVSKEVAEAMAAGARRRTGATYALAVTGVAGPGGGSEQKPVGSVFVGLADASGCQTLHRQFLGDRARIRAFASQMALDMLRRKCTLVV
ncbi:MAG: competence/damage-inducible protein A [Acidobacteria bacterium]|nr:competence/damage-inducible protein A [Acidobacteriota bacterium]